MEGAARERRAVAAAAKYFILVTSEVLVGGMGKRVEGLWRWDWCWSCGLMLEHKAGRDAVYIRRGGWPSRGSGLPRVRLK